MSLTQSIYHTYHRYRTLKTDRITALPIVILMPHSACNCRCVMCDIWKDNSNLKQLREEDVLGLLSSLRKLGTQQVLFSGGEALLNPNFFRLCSILRNHHISIVLLSTGLTIKKNADLLVRHVDEMIVSLDGDESTHNYIRNIPEAFQKLKQGVVAIKALDPRFRVTGRSVIHRINFRQWPRIIESAIDLGLNRISFLPADVSSHAFNREVLWSPQRQHAILPDKDELPELKEVIEKIIADHSERISSGFIAESPEKLRNIYNYYAAFYELKPFPFKKCNAPWVSVVVEADGTVRPCFFHASLGNIRQQSLDMILNSEKAIAFRKQLDTDKDSTCKKCVCYLNLSPGTKLNG